VDESLARRAVNAIIGRRPLSRFIQIDRLVAVMRGAGTTTTSDFSLPHGRYTVFVDVDPPSAAHGFAFLNSEGEGVRQDWRPITRFAANVPVPLVQHELPAGIYHVVIDVEPPTSAWMAQVVLNSMLSWERPPRRWRSPLPPPTPIAVDGASRTLAIAQTGPYEISWTIGDRQVNRHPIRPYSLDLVAADDHVIHLGHATDSEGHSVAGAFLGAGEWVVDMKTEFPWRLEISPAIGPLGGGAWAFSR
jgi:hypothetical protein